MNRKGQTNMDVGGLMYWIGPIVALLMIFTVFSAQITMMLAGIASTEFKTLALLFVFFIASLVGLSLVYVFWTGEDLSWVSLSQRIFIIVICVAAAWGVNSMNAIFPV
jgi:hypothetical protein